MATQISPKGKKFFRLLAILLIVGGIGYYLNSKGYLDRLYKKSVTVSGIDLGTAPKNAKTSGLVNIGVPSTTVSSQAGKYGSLTLNLMEWNAQQPLIFANGGPQTTEGSLLEKYGVKLTLVRQDDDNQSVQQMIKFGKEYKDNPNIPGFGFVDMGDGGMVLLQNMNAELSKLGPDYEAVIVGASGFSNGEDGLWAPVSWRENPQNAKGGVVSVVMRNGDYNVLLIWAQQNNIPVNNDEHSYSPDAINFVNASDFQKAGEMYITGYKETRPVVKDGKKTGETKEIHIDGVSTWSPVDINITSKRGGLVRIFSTHDNQTQMPACIFTIKKYAQDHKDLIEGLLKGVTNASDQLNSYSSSLAVAGDLSAKVYNDQNGDFWTKLAKGYTTTDKQGLTVDLGGSGFYNLADNINTFSGSASTYEVVYNTFSKKYLEYFPELFKSFPKYEDAVDLTYLRDLESSADVSKTAAATTTFTKGSISQVVAKRSYNIEFATGQATLTPDGQATVDDIYNQLTISNNLKVELDGYTDGTGSQSVNQPLSLARANAVKTYLQSNSLNAFPDDRFIIQGYGSENPVGDNSTKAGQKANRRVNIILGR